MQVCLEMKEIGKRDWKGSEHNSILNYYKGCDLSADFTFVKLGFF